MIKSDETIQKDVQDAIKWEPLLQAAEIGVIVKNGVVTLTGTVDNYIKKNEAESATKNVSGVKAVIEKIEVHYNSIWNGKTDQNIADEIINTLNWNPHGNNIQVKVENGWVTLEGELTWNYLRESAIKAVNNIGGIKGISNKIKIKPTHSDTIEKTAIEKAFSRNWSINETAIGVAVKDNEVTLTGVVDSYYQKDEAERIAWNAPGVGSVNNELAVGYID